MTDLLGNETTDLNAKVHIFVDRSSKKIVKILDGLRKYFKRLLG